MTKINSLFEKNPLRPINGVVKADEQTEEALWPELEEYVITKELDRHFHRFFANYTQSLRNTESASADMGVWISGYFGSGKSHFLKMLSCLLGNATARSADGEERTAIDFFRSKIDDSVLMADIEAAGRAGTDVILFNVDSKAQAGNGDDAILSVFWKVFNEMRGYYGASPHIAAMERYLEENGCYDAFQDKFLECSGKEWKEDRDAWLFKRDSIVKALSVAAGMSRESALEWFKDKGKSFSLSIETFAKEVRDYLDKRGKSHRIVFLVDEIGQFIGTDTKRMLQLQTVTENLGTYCKGRAWVVVTSQEAIEDIVGVFNRSKSNDFSKIQGRFSTKLSLSSSNTDEVIQHRLLKKNPEATKILCEFWNDHGDAVSARLLFSSDGPTLPRIVSGKHFAADYPFVPYQFQLVQKIFEAIRKAGATGAHLSQGERSMLVSFQAAMKRVYEKPVGTFIPLYEFYDPIQDFLDTVVKATIERASSNPALKQPLDSQLLRTLFLIRYVDLVVPTLDNLVPLFLTEWDGDRIALKDALNESLGRLEKETLISRNGDRYFFLTDEERDISREIKNEVVATTDVSSELRTIIFDEVMGQMAAKFRMKDFNGDYPYSRYLDGQIHSAHSVQELGFEVVSQFGDDFTKEEPAMMMHSGRFPDRVLIYMPESEDLNRELLVYVQTKKYLKGPKGHPDKGSLKQIVAARAEENAERLHTLKNIVNRLLCGSTAYHCSLPVKTSGKDISSIVVELLTYLVKNVYNRFSLLKRPHESESACRKEIEFCLKYSHAQEGTLVDIDDPNSDALKDLEEYVRMIGGVNNSLQSITNRYWRKPFGWPEWETACLVARLYQRGALSIAIGQDMSPDSKDILAIMQKPSRWGEIILRVKSRPAEQDVKKAGEVYIKIKGHAAGADSLSILSGCRNLLQSWDDELAEYARYGEEYPGKNLLTEARESVRLLSSINDDAEFAAAFAKAREEILDVQESLETLKDFFSHQIAVWNRMTEGLKTFEQHKVSLGESKEALEAIERLKRIREMPEPWNSIKEVGNLLSTIDGILKSQIEKARAEASEKVSEMIERYKETLASLQAPDGDRNYVLNPLKELHDKVHNINGTVSDISYVATQDSLLTKAVERFEEIRIRLSHKPVKSGSKLSITGERTTKPKTVSMHITDLVSGIEHLSSIQDVEKFTASLHDKLISYLDGNVTIVIRK